MQAQDPTAPTGAATAEAARLRGLSGDRTGRRVVIDMSTYAAAAARLARPTPLGSVFKGSRVRHDLGPLH